MAISAYTGLPRSGKSYSIWEYSIIPALKSGREVWTNIPFHVEKVTETFHYCPVHFDIDDIKNNNNWFESVLPAGVLIVIDECWRLWPAGMKATQASEDHLAFIAEHGHLVGENGKSTEVIIATQDLSQIASFARALVANTFRSVKLDAVGQDNKFRVDIYQGSVTGPNPPEKNRIDQRFGSYKKSVFQYYISHTKSETGFPGDESRQDNRFNMLKGSYFKYSLMLICFLLWFASWGFTKVKEGYGSEDIVVVSEIPTVSNSSDTSVSSTPVTKRIPLIYDFFSDFDVSITFNLNDGVNFNYQFSFKSGDKLFSMSSSELVEFGYILQPLNQCVAFVHVNGNKHLVTCEESDSSSLVDFDWNVNPSDA